MRSQGLSAGDFDAVADQLGRAPRGAVAVGWRCPCGRPGVVVTAPILPDGTPFPTLYYLTCPRAVKLCSTLEAGGRMGEMAARLLEDKELSDAYHRAHESYLTDRATWAARLEQDESAIVQVSAGGMPTRVKCLHAVAAHALAAGPGVNPLGDEVVAELGRFWDVAGCQPVAVADAAPGVSATIVVDGAEVDSGGPIVGRRAPKTEGGSL